MKSKQKTPAELAADEKRLTLNYGRGLTKAIKGTRHAKTSVKTLAQDKPLPPAERNRLAKAGDLVTGRQFMERLGWQYLHFVGAVGSGLLPKPKATANGTMYFSKRVVGEFCERLGR